MVSGGSGQAKKESDDASPHTSKGANLPQVTHLSMQVVDMQTTSDFQFCPN
jgi:hypothetical protein